jgi:hypothetical protein
MRVLLSTVSMVFSSVALAQTPTCIPEKSVPIEVLTADYQIVKAYSLGRANITLGEGRIVTMPMPVGTFAFDAGTMGAFGNFEIIMWSNKTPGGANGPISHNIDATQFRLPIQQMVQTGRVRMTYEQALMRYSGVPNFKPNQYSKDN